MKADETRAPLPVKHQLDHQLPTVIHHPEEDMPLLARWLDQAMQNQTRFWGLIAAIVLVTIGLSLVGNGLTRRRSITSEAWTRLDAAKTPGERVELAKDFPKTPAERWAKLQAATEYYDQGFRELPQTHESALANLKKALDLFDEVSQESEPGSPQARAAAFGAARTQEARGDLPKAIKLYEQIAKNPAWKDTNEARSADRLASVLKTPEAVAFYKELYAHKAPTATLPPGGMGKFDIPLPAGHPPLGGSMTAPFSIPGLPGEPSPLSVPPPPTADPARAAVPATTLPDDPFAPTKDAPKPETPKPE